MLYRANLLIVAEQKEAYNFIIDIAASGISFENIVLWLQKKYTTYSRINNYEE